MLPIAISACFLREATTEVTSSGAEVPNAIIVNHIMDSGTLNDRAILTADQISRSAQRANHISQRIINKNDRARVCSWSISHCSTSGFPLFASQNVYAKNNINNKRNTKLSPLYIMFSVAHEKKVSNAKKNKAKEAIKEKGTSLLIVDDFACKGYTIAATHNTSQVFAIFDPTIFQSAKSVSHLIAENIFTNNSGADVPNATIVSHITSGEIPYLVARLLAQLTRISAPLMRITNQNMRYT